MYYEHIVHTLLVARTKISQLTHRDNLSEIRNCVNIEVDVLGSSFLRVRTVSVDESNVEPNN